jgi:hypothetical protein
MLHCVALVGTDVLEERSASIIRATIIGEIGTMLAVTSKPTHTAKKYYVRKEALVCNTKLRLQRGVGVESNGMGLGRLRSEIP